jgi:hypothetical protein
LNNDTIGLENKILQEDIIMFGRLFRCKRVVGQALLSDRKNIGIARYFCATSRVSRSTSMKVNIFDLSEKYEGKDTSLNRDFLLGYFEKRSQVTEQLLRLHLKELTEILDQPFPFLNYCSLEIETNQAVVPLIELLTIFFNRDNMENEEAINLSRIIVWYSKRKCTQLEAQIVPPQMIPLLDRAITLDPSNIKLLKFVKTQKLKTESVRRENAEWKFGRM